MSVISARGHRGGVKDAQCMGHESIGPHGKPEVPPYAIDGKTVDGTHRARLYLLLLLMVLLCEEL